MKSVVFYVEIYINSMLIKKIIKVINILIVDNLEINSLLSYNTKLVNKQEE